MITKTGIMVPILQYTTISSVNMANVTEISMYLKQEYKIWDFH